MIVLAKISCSTVLVLSTWFIPWHCRSAGASEVDLKCWMRSCSIGGLVGCCVSAWRWMRSLGANFSWTKCYLDTREHQVQVSNSCSSTGIRGNKIRTLLADPPSCVCGHIPQQFSWNQTYSFTYFGSMLKLVLTRSLCKVLYHFWKLNSMFFVDLQQRSEEENGFWRNRNIYETDTIQVSHDMKPNQRMHALSKY